MCTKFVTIQGKSTSNHKYKIKIINNSAITYTYI